jgi:hypothetical protein
MPFSIHLRLPVPTPETGTGGFVRSLLAIKEHIVDRFDGALHSWHEGRPSDGSRPDPWVHVLLTFDDTVDLLEVCAALNQLHADAGFMAPKKRDAK